MIIPVIYILFVVLILSIPVIYILFVVLILSIPVIHILVIVVLILGILAVRIPVVILIRLCRAAIGSILLTWYAAAVGTAVRTAGIIHIIKHLALVIISF